MRGLIGKKIGMTRVFDQGGHVVPVTVLQAGPCTVVQVKTEEKDGYDAVQVGFGVRKEKHTSSPLKGHFKSTGTVPQKILVEFDIVPGFDYKPGQSFHVGLFQEGECVRVSGTSKGKGFTGVIKRHNFSRQKKTHGTGHTERSAGSIGQASDPSRVFPGMRMAGHHGNSKVTVENLEIVKVDKVNNQLLVKGAVPGSKNGTVIISK
jgi:large subunit ribosomal protein L3